MAPLRQDERVVHELERPLDVANRLGFAATTGASGVVPRGAILVSTTVETLDAFLFVRNCWNRRDGSDVNGG